MHQSVFSLLLLAGALAGCHSFSHGVPAEGMIGTQAPDFSLADAQRPGQVSLSALAKTGPVIVIFHRGLHCSICAAHLAGISRSFDGFKSAGVQVVAIGPDTPEQARDALGADGSMPFPLLSDPDDRVARAYKLARDDGYILHATFVVDTHGRIRWGGTSDDPVGEAAELLAKAKAAR